MMAWIWLGGEAASAEKIEASGKAKAAPITIPA
jgi:hypothetical protein